MRALPIMMYHHVSPAPGLVTISPDNFASQMRWLVENGWRTLSAASFAEGLVQGAWPEKSLLLTFDDGYLDNWLFAYPVLKKYGLHAIIFLVTGWVGDGPVRNIAGLPSKVLNHGEAMKAIATGLVDDAILRWSEVEEMQVSGLFEFHSHTHSHTRWDQIEPDIGLRHEHLAADLAASKSALMSHLGMVKPHLCWPQGYFDSEYQDVARAAGFTHLYTTRPGAVDAATQPIDIPRVVAKDKPGNWLGGRLRIYSRPVLARWYTALKAVGGRAQ